MQEYGAIRFQFQFCPVQKSLMVNSTHATHTQNKNMLNQFFYPSVHSGLILHSVMTKHANTIVSLLTEQLSISCKIEIIMNNMYRKSNVHTVKHKMKLCSVLKYAKIHFVHRQWSK